MEFLSAGVAVRVKQRAGSPEPNKDEPFLGMYEAYVRCALASKAAFFEVVVQEQELLTETLELGKRHLTRCGTVVTSLACSEAPNAECLRAQLWEKD